ncbi:MAG: B3/B4 domain-containing protein [Promethearchaeota archaeon]
MPLNLSFSNDLAESGINLTIASWNISDFQILNPDYDFSPTYSAIIDKLLTNHTVDSIKTEPLIQYYRKFYWHHLSLDPTKVRPSSEALIRRILHKKQIPRISPLVDAYNWASALSMVPMGSYDTSTFQGPIQLRFSSSGEVFNPIGKSSQELKPGKLIISDSKGLVLTQYPYRDSKVTMITPQTTSAIILACGVNGVPREYLDNALATTKKHLDFLVENTVIDYTAGEIRHFSVEIL